MNAARVVKKKEEKKGGLYCMGGVWAGWGMGGVGVAPGVRTG